MVCSVCASSRTSALEERCISNIWELPGLFLVYGVDWDKLLYWCIALLSMLCARASGETSPYSFFYFSHIICDLTNMRCVLGSNAYPTFFFILRCSRYMFSHPRITECKGQFECCITNDGHGGRSLQNSATTSWNSLNKFLTLALWKNFYVRATESSRYWEIYF